MITTELTIINKLGLHARAAAKFVDCTQSFASKVRVANGGDLVDAKSIMSVMMLAAGQGTVLTVEIDGRDEEAALEALTTLLANRFDEEE